MVITLGAAVAWTLGVGSSIGSYLEPVLGGAATGLWDLLTGGGGGKMPFHTSGAPPVPLLERLVGLGSVVLLLVALGAGLLLVWARKPVRPLAVVLCFMAALYPVTLVLGLTEAGRETSNRASEFVFLGLGLLVGILVARSPTTALRRRLMTGLAGAALAFLFAGGIIVGWAPQARLPGPFLVVADPRSVEVHNVAAARWADTALPARSRIVADRVTALLFSAYGRQDPQVGMAGGLPVADLITSPVFGLRERHIIQADKVRFIIIDKRLSKSRPLVGYYVDRDSEPQAFRYRKPISRKALEKFEGAAGLARIYDNGPIVVYDTATLLGLDATAGYESPRH
jgi:hypothetical protein